MVKRGDTGILIQDVHQKATKITEEKSIHLESSKLQLSKSYPMPPPRSPPCTLIPQHARPSPQKGPTRTPRARKLSDALHLASDPLVVVHKDEIISVLARRTESLLRRRLTMNSPWPCYCRACGQQCASQREKNLPEAPSCRSCRRKRTSPLHGLLSHVTAGPQSPPLFEEKQAFESICTGTVCHPF